MEIKIEIPVKPLVKTYLENNFGKPVRLDRKTHLGKYFYSLLDNPSKNYDHQCKGYNQSVAVCLNDSVFIRYGYTMTKTNVHALNNYITDIVYELLVQTIEIKKGADASNFQIKETIAWFCKKYKFPDEALSYDAAKKFYQRYRNKVKQQGNNKLKIFTQSVP